MSFNLLNEPWIPVYKLDHSRATLSLRELFDHLSEIRRLDTELPTQSVAILRLLLAICHDAIGFHSSDDIAAVLHHGFDVPKIQEYLTFYEDRFDLFHSEWPFYQVATLEAQSGEIKGLDIIIADIPNNDKFLTTRGSSAVETMPTAEAAIWLLHTQAYDPNGIRTAAVGDPLCQAGKGYGIGPSWPGQIGAVVLHGQSFGQTLALNLAPTPNNPDDRPVWTREEPPTEQRKMDYEVAGPVELLTLQSRRMRLFGDSSQVTAVVLCQGDQYQPQNRQKVEFMTAWRYSEPQSKKFNHDVYMPQLHDPARAGWRGAPTILGVKHVNKKGIRLALPPATVTNVEEMSLFEDLPTHITVELIGIEYGPQRATVADIYHDTLDFRTALLSSQAESVVAMMNDAIADTDQAVFELGRFAGNLARAAGDFDGVDSASTRAKELGWYALENPARRWISQLGPESDLTREQRSWQQQVKAILMDQGAKLLEQCSPAALTGAKSSYGYLTAAKAEIFFRAALRKALPLAHELPQEEKPDDTIF